MIYVVEDDSSIRELVVYTLNHTGFTAEGFEDGKTMENRLQKKLPELILLDLMLPGEDGISLLRRLKSNAGFGEIPVIILTAKNSEFDKVTGLDSGADDYITKPFGMMELISRVKAVLRRAGREKHEVYSCDGVVLDVSAHRITVDGNEKEVTRKEFEILRLLMKNAGIVMTRETLLQQVWDYDFEGETRTVDVHIRTLRVKLGEKGDIIETVRGVGYRIGGVS